MKRPIPAGRWWLRLETGIVLALTVTVLAVYWPSVGNDFVNYDDDHYVTDNPQVQAGLTAESWHWAWTSTEFANWHPLTWISLQMDRQLQGPRPAGFHRTNLLLHLANTLLLFGVLRWLTQAPWRSAWVAALFGLHPLHVESVAWVAERKDVLSALFWIGIIGAYGAYAARPSRIRYLLVAATFALGLTAKPMLVTLPCVLLLLDYWPLQRYRPVATQRARRGPAPQQRFVAARWSWLVLEKVPLLILSAASCVVTIQAQGQQGATVTLAQLPFHLRIGTALAAYFIYIVKMVWPADLAVFYPYAPASTLLWEAIAGGLVLVAISILVIRLGRQFPYLIVGWLWYLGTLVPVIGLVQVGSQALADRYTYIPLIGLFIMLAWGLADLAANWASVGPVVPWLAGLSLIGCAAMSWIQVGYWHDSVSLWQHTLEATTDNPFAENQLGYAYLQQKQYAEAVPHFQAALRLKKDFAAAQYNLSVAHNNWGLVLAQEGHLEEAVSHYGTALQIDPRYAEARNNLGMALAQQGHLAEAEKCFVEAVRLAPELAEAHQNLGLALTQQGKTTEAIAQFAEAVRLRPTFSLAHTNWGYALLQRGRLPEAIDRLAQALHHNPEDADAWSHLGTALALSGKKDKAESCFRQAVHWQPRMGEYYYGLAHVFQEKGQSESAKNCYEQARRLDPRWPQAANQSAWMLATHPNSERRYGALALRLAQQVCEATAYRRPEALDTLAAAYAETGDFTAAQESIRKALALLGTSDAQRAQALQSRLSLYERHEPFRDKAGS
jgi:tetratricopeptide (TPR) repeat protein